jgi:hypothetical protein
VDLAFVPAGSEAARRRFPQLDHAATTRDLTAISDEGAVYTGANAWLICLWALHDYRAWSLRLSSPELLPLARWLVIWVSQNRFRFGNRELDDILSDGVAGGDLDALGDACADRCDVAQGS